MPKEGEDHAGAFVEGEIVACALERTVVLEQGFGRSACPELGASALGRRNRAEPTVAASFGMHERQSAVVEGMPAAAALGPAADQQSVDPAQADVVVAGELERFVAACQIGVECLAGSGDALEHVGALGPG